MAAEFTQGDSINGNGFTTIQRFTSSSMTQSNELSIGVNVDMSSSLGVVKSSKGYEAFGTTGNSSVLGLHGHITSTGTGIPVRVLGTKAQYHNGTDWVDSTMTFLAASARARFVSFLDRIFLVNGTQTVSTSDGNAWNTTQLTNAPANCSFISVYNSRLFLIDKKTINWSSIPDASLNITWNTAAYNVLPNPYDGDFITGCLTLRAKMLVFKNHSTYRFIQYDNTNVNLMAISESIGCPVQEAVTAYNDTAYFFGVSKDGQAGIYASNGESIDLISRPVQDILNNVPSTSWSSIRAGVFNGTVKFFLGDITIDSDSLDKRTILKCELRYSTLDNTWSIRSLAHIPTVYAPIMVSGTRFLSFGESSGLVMRDEFSTTFNGTQIQSEITTHPIAIAEMGKYTKLKEVWIDGDNLQFTTVQYRGDCPPLRWKEASNLLKTRDDIFKSKIDEKGKDFRLKVSWNRFGAEIKRIYFKRNGEDTEIV